MNTAEEKRSYWALGNLARKAWFWIAMFFLALTIYHQDAIRGNWKFDRLCKEEAGARFYGKVEKGHGWIVDNPDEFEYQIPFDFGGVAFVRYTNKRGERFDVTKTSTRRQNSSGGHFDHVDYIFSPVDESRVVRYRLASTHFVTMSDDPRFSRYHLAVIDLADGRTLATDTAYSYRWTKPERVILNAPTAVTCPDDGGKSRRELIMKLGGWE